MPFLTLNNVTIPTLAEAGAMATKEIGERTQAYDGTYQIDIRARKRVWTFQTQPMPPLKSAMLRGLLHREGLYLPFDANNLATNYNTSAGLAPQAGAGTSIRFGNSQKNPLPVVDENGTYESYQGLGALSSQRAITNQLTLAQSETTSTAGFTLMGGASMATDTGTVMSGSSSIKVTAAANSDGVQLIAATGGSIGDTMYASMYVCGTPGKSVQVDMYDFQHVTFLGSATLTFNATSRWQRIVAHGALPATCTSVGFQLYSTSGAHTFYVAQIQVEKNLAANTSTNYAGSWVPGASTQAAANLEWNAAGLVGPQGCTFNLWVTRPPNLQNEVLACILDSTGNNFLLRILSQAAGNLLWQLGSADLTTTVNLIEAPGAWDNAWHMLTLVYYANPSAGESNLYVYKDGVLLGSSTTTLCADPVNASKLQIGHEAGANHWGGRIDEVQILPFPVDQSWVTGTYNAGSALIASGSFALYPQDRYNISGQVAATPYLNAGGLSDQEPSILVAGRVTEEKYVSFYDGSQWRSNGRQITFELTEV